MPSIHPSENPPLGWLVPCLAVADLTASLDFYAKLDLVRYGGDPKENWAMLRSRAVEIHLFEGHIPKDLLNFRGGDPEAIRSALAERGLAIASEQGPGSFTVLDPDGREVFFDTCAEEIAAYESGQPLTAPVPEKDVHAGPGLDLGNLTCCLDCAELEATRGFYRSLGLVPAGGVPEEGWAILARADHMPAPGKRLVGTSLSLFRDMIPEDMLNLRGGNVGSIAETIAGRGVDLLDGVQTAPDGGECLLVRDPDGRAVFFDTTPPERLYAS
jgi:catechol 2,3-dioxygenase-like lactoylglutathione lyase family enzyme